MIETDPDEDEDTEEASNAQVQPTADPGAGHGANDDGGWRDDRDGGETPADPGQDDDADDDPDDEADDEEPEKPRKDKCLREKVAARAANTQLNQANEALFLAKHDLGLLEKKLAKLLEERRGLQFQPLSRVDTTTSDRKGGRGKLAKGIYDLLGGIFNAEVDDRSRQRLQEIDAEIAKLEIDIAKHKEKVHQTEDIQRDAQENARAKNDALMRCQKGESSR